MTDKRDTAATMPTDAPDDQTDVFAFLVDPATHGLSEPVKRIDTHAAAVFLAGANVYKIKKAIRFPFMDQSTLDRRRHACEAELTVNRHFTPELYLGTVAIVRDRDGRLQLGGPGDVVEWAVHLKRFDENETFDLLADRGAITPAIVAEIARLIAQSHRVAPVRDGSEATDGLGGVMEETLTELLDAPAIFPAGEAATLAQTMRSAYRNVRPLLLERAHAGRVRRCHGDLHLRNIAIFDGRPILFDGIEFDESIATTDVLYDLAFVLMDLCERKLGGEANLLLNRYLWSLTDMPDELPGLATLPLFLSLRASVLAKIAAIRFRDGHGAEAAKREASRYFDVASGFLKPAERVLVGIGGLSGSGKSAVAARLAPAIGRAPGAVHLRSDIERKRLLGAGELDRLPPEAYARDVTDRVFTSLRAMAEATLEAGHSVVVDAVHRMAEERAALAEVAERAGARFVGLWLDAPVEVLSRRVAARTGDASDATVAVVEAQVAEPLGEIEWRRLDASRSLDAVAGAARAVCAAGAR